MTKSVITISLHFNFTPILTKIICVLITRWSLLSFQSLTMSHSFHLANQIINSHYEKWRSLFVHLPAQAHKTLWHKIILRLTWFQRAPSTTDIYSNASAFIHSAPCQKQVEFQCLPTLYIYPGVSYRLRSYCTQALISFQLHDTNCLLAAIVL